MTTTTSPQPRHNHLRNIDGPASGEQLSVLHIVVADQKRGAERVAIELAHQMRSQGVSSWVVALGPGESGSGWHGEIIRGSQKPGATLRSVPTLSILTMLLRPEIIIGHGAAAARAALLIPRRPPVIWQRILALPNHVTSSGPRRFAMKQLARRVDGVVALTGETANEVQRLGFEGPLALVPNHRPGGRFLTQDRRHAKTALCEMLRLPNRTPIVGFVGHLVPQKSPLTFVEMASDPRLSDVHFVVAGDGSLMSAVEQAAALSPATTRIHLLGHRDDIPGILAGLDLLIICSQSESMTGTAVEAQMCGTPVVSYNLDGMDSLLLGELPSGTVLENRSVDALATAVTTLLGNPAERARQSSNARQKSRLLDTELATIKYLDLCRTILSSSRRGTK